MKFNMSKFLSNLQWKMENNHVYFKVVSDIEINDLSIYIKETATLYPSSLKAINEKELYLSVIYTEEVEGELSEGLIRIDYESLSALLIAKKIIPFNTVNDKPDDNILEIVKNF